MGSQFLKTNTIFPSSVKKTFEPIQGKIQEIVLEPPQTKKRQIYPWQTNQTSNFPTITKEHFRCRGSILNPPRITQNPNAATMRLYDCGGKDKHSLPLKNGKEYIYPILTDLLNYIQEKLKRRVIITSGHRCPEHNTYVDPSVENQSSKHLIGAEVSFYVQGMEDYPEAVLEPIFQYYVTKYDSASEYRTFCRYQGKTNTTTPPWFNKEIFVKIFRAHEGRNQDNRHPFPYIAIQVRHDLEENKKINCNWNLANKNYLRY